jgi:dTDP-4-amino-4,6-dideoxygalactose transaminase
MIPFSPPRIDQRIIDEVTDTLRSGWITTGPKTKRFEKEISAYCGCKTTVAVNSWTMGMQVFLSWYGIKEGDEVIIPAYTYCASANVIVHAGATPIMVDINPEDFNLSLDAVRKAITPRTKAIMAVDLAGFPCDYSGLMQMVQEPIIRKQFQANSPRQHTLGRILVISDAAHSFGAISSGKRSGAMADVTAFSFHAVKNLTTAEGGALCFNFPSPFDHEEIYRQFCTLILHGQSKDALAKTQKGNWRYDVDEPGFKCNMTDIQASIGLIELERYQENLDRRKVIFEKYDTAFANQAWALLPLYSSADRTSSYHLYQLRIKDINEAQRDAILQGIFDREVSVNVHFIPLPLLTAYKKRGYDITQYPETYRKFASEISLPVYFDLSDEQVATVIQSVIEAVEEVIN